MPRRVVMAMVRPHGLLLALAATVALGLASRLYPVGWFLWDRASGKSFMLWQPTSLWLWSFSANRRC